MFWLRLAPAGALLCVLAASAWAANDSKPGQVLIEEPTFNCLGVRWIIEGDDNRNATVKLEYRAKTSNEWKRAQDLLRIETVALQGVTIPPESQLFAGSVIDLNENTDYELRLTLSDPDGGDAGRTVSARMWSEPQAAKDARVLHVVPGEGGGSGTAAHPFKGLNAAQDAAKPGDIFLVHKGVYQGTFTIKKNGEPGRPIVWRAAGDGDAILDGGGAERTVSASGAKCIMFEGLTIRNAQWGIVAHGGSDVTCRRCHFMKIDSGFVAHSDGQKRIVVTDCLIEGPCVWPRSKGIEDPEGVEIQGEAVVVAWNRIHGFGDGISIFRGPSHAVDIYKNDVSECTDDGIEMDYGGQNTRCLRNRLTNCFQGLSFQPLYGGPCYAVRNVVYNLELEGYKLHNAPSGVLLYHNTTVRRGMDFVLYTGEKVTNMRARNNLFVGTTDKYALESVAPMINADWDYDGYAGGPWNNFAKWNKKIYKTFDDFRQNSGVENHAVEVSLKGLFATGIEPPADFRTQFDPKVNDLRLAPGSQAIDAGEVLPNINDGFKGKAPDLGALELDDGLPIYGPRPLKNHPN